MITMILLIMLIIVRLIKGPGEDLRRPGHEAAGGLGADEAARGGAYELQVGIRGFDVTYIHDV